MPDYIVLLSTLGGISLWIDRSRRWTGYRGLFMAARSLFVAGNTSGESSTPHASAEPENSG